MRYLTFTLLLPVSLAVSLIGLMSCTLMLFTRAPKTEIGPDSWGHR